MPTESEREWLENRKPGDWCVTHDCSAMFEGECISVTCYMDISWLYRDAAEFEARVATKLAINDTSYLPCHQKGHENQCPYDNYCPTDKKKTAWCKVKHARLAVEEEMDELSV
jgi:hypothetical protein